MTIKSDFYREQEVTGSKLENLIQSPTDICNNVNN